MRLPGWLHRFIVGDVPELEPLASVEGRTPEQVAQADRVIVESLADVRRELSAAEVRIRALGVGVEVVQHREHDQSARRRIRGGHSNEG